MAESSRGGLSGYLLMAAGVLLVAIAAAGWYTASASHEAYALLKVSSVQRGVLGEAPYDPEQFSVFKRSQVQLLLSNVVLNGVLRDKSISELSIVKAHSDDPVAWLKSQLIIDYPDDAEIMRVTLRGPHPQELARVVDKVVSVYLQEIVERDKQQKLTDEEKLRRAHQQQASEYEKQLAALRNLETIHKTSGSGEAQLKRKVATDELDRLIAQRARIAEEIRQLEVEIGLAKDRVKTASQEVRTTSAAIADEPATGLSPAELEHKKKILEGQLESTGDLVEQQVEAVSVLDSFSAQVANAQENLAAFRAIKDRVGAQIDRAVVERLAPDRISLLNQATVTENRNTLVQSQLLFGGIGALGLVLSGIGAGLLARRRS